MISIKLLYLIENKHEGFPQTENGRNTYSCSFNNNSRAVKKYYSKPFFSCLRCLKISLKCQWKPAFRFPPRKSCVYVIWIYALCVIYLSIDNVNYDIHSVLNSFKHKTIFKLFNYNKLHITFYILVWAVIPLKWARDVLRVQWCTG